MKVTGNYIHPLLGMIRDANTLRQKEWANSDKITLDFRALELVNEVGELVGALKKYYRGELGIAGSSSTLGHVAEEMGDVLTCWDLLRTAQADHMIENEDLDIARGSLSADPLRMGLELAGAVGLWGEALIAFQDLPPHANGSAETRVAYQGERSLCIALQLAEHLGLDPYACWAEKFNAVSRKLGMSTWIDVGTGALSSDREEGQWSGYI